MHKYAPCLLHCTTAHTCRRDTPGFATLPWQARNKKERKAHKPFRGSMIHLSTHRISNSTTAVCNVHICLDEHTFKLYKHTPLFKRLEKHIRIILSVLAFKQTYIQLVDKSTKVHHLHMHTHQIHVFKYKDTRPYEELTEIHTHTHASTHIGMPPTHTHAPTHIGMRTIIFLCIHLRPQVHQ